MSFPSCFVKSHCLHSSIMNHSKTFSFLGTVFTENASEIGRAVVESGELRVEIGTFVLWFSCTYLESTWRQGAELTKPHMSHLLTSMTGLTNNSEVKLSLPLFDLLCCWGGWVTESLRNKWRWSQGLSFGLPFGYGFVFIFFTHLPEIHGRAAASSSCFSEFESVPCHGAPSILPRIFSWIVLIKGARITFAIKLWAEKTLRFEEETSYCRW